MQRKEKEYKTETRERKINNESVDFTYFLFTEEPIGTKVIDVAKKLVSVVHTETRTKDRNAFVLRSFFDLSNFSSERILLLACESLLIRVYRKMPKVKNANNVGDFLSLSEVTHSQDLLEEIESIRERKRKSDSEKVTSLGISSDLNEFLKICEHMELSLKQALNFAKKSDRSEAEVAQIREYYKSR